MLGTLDSDERSAAQSLLAEDAEFATKAKVWERRLGELHLMVEPVEPEGDIWQRIKAKLPEVQPAAVIAPAEIEPGLELQPEPDRIPDQEPEPAIERKPEPQPQPEPAIIAAEGVPARHDAPPAAPDAPASAQMQVAPAVAAVEAALRAALRPSVDEPAAPTARLAAPAPPTPTVARDEKLRIIRRHLVRWRTVAVLMIVAVFAVAALLSLWKYLPERVPPVLRPLALMRLVGITIDASSGLREPAPPESQFDE